MILLLLIAKYVTAAGHKQIFPSVASKGYYKSRSAASQIQADRKKIL